MMFGSISVSSVRCQNDMCTVSTVAPAVCERQALRLR